MQTMEWLARFVLIHRHVHQFLEGGIVVKASFGIMETEYPGHIRTGFQGIFFLFFEVLTNAAPGGPT